MRWGIIYGLLACMCWGLNYVLPSLVSGFSTLEVVMGRYFVYGLVSLGMLLFKGVDQFRYLASFIPLACLLSLMGFIGYDLLDVTNIRSVGPCIAGMLSSMSVPIIALGTSFFADTKVEWHRLLVAMVFAVVGAFCMFLGVSSSLLADGGISGLKGAVMVLSVQTLLWNSYSALLRRTCNRWTELSPTSITSLIGVASLILSCLILLPMVMSNSGSPIAWWEEKSPQDLRNFLFASLIAGTLISWTATELWCRASTRLTAVIVPFFLTGDVIFGHLYTYSLGIVSHTRWEVLGSICTIIGAIYTGFGASRGSAAPDLAGAACPVLGDSQIV
ncbi:MAG: DMT family transporter [Chlamydiia bacterium]|nr:DMT family transporter [Chlamydiia bacterium]